MSKMRKATDSAFVKVQKSLKTWESVDSLRSFEKERCRELLSLLDQRPPRGMKRTAQFNRRKASEVLCRINDEYGLVVIFLLSTVSSMTEIARINASDFLRQMRSWDPNFPVNLQRAVLSIKHDEISSHNMSALADASELSKDARKHTTPGEFGERQEDPDLSVPEQSIQHYEIPVEFLAEFLKRLNGGSGLRLTVARGTNPEAPYFELGKLPKARVSLNYTLSAELLKRIVGAETLIRPDGTVVLTGCRATEAGAHR